MAYYSKRHHDLVRACGSRQADDGLGGTRRLDASLRQQAYEEMLKKFGDLTFGNAGEAIPWMNARIKELHDTCLHTAHYNGMVWQVRGPLAQSGDDFMTKAEALKSAARKDYLYHLNRSKS